MMQLGKAAASELLKHTKRLMYQPNLLPPSLHLMRAVVEAEDWSDFEVHVCSRSSCSHPQGHVFPFLPKAEWKAHAADQCPHCNGPRFVTSHVSGEMN